MLHTSIQALIPACCIYIHVHEFSNQSRHTVFIRITSFYLSLTGADYDDTIILKTFPPGTTSRVVIVSIIVIDDDINEIGQRFALVGELEPEIPDEFACFRVTFDEAECRGRVGATGIRIRDNDR